MYAFEKRESPEQVISSLLDELRSCVDRETALLLLKRCHAMSQISGNCHESLVNMVCKGLFPRC